MSFSIDLFSIEEVYDISYEGDNCLYDVSFMGHVVFRVEVPQWTEVYEIEQAVIRAVFNDKIRGEVEAWLSNE